MPKTTKAHFKYFKKHVKKYMKKWKVTGWNVYFYWEDTEGNLAKYGADYRAGAASFAFGTKWKGVSVTKKRIKHAAKHEVGHLIVDPLYSLSLERCISRDELDTADERLVNHLVELLP